MIDYNSILIEINKTEVGRQLSETEIDDLDYCFFKCGVVWEIITEINFRGKNLEIIFYLNFPDDFPLTLPKIFLAKNIYEPMMYIPHVNKDYSICIFDEGLNFKEPESVPKFIELFIAKAKKIIRDSENEQYNLEEFKREFKAYWELSFNNSDRFQNGGFHSIKNKNLLSVKGIKFINTLLSEYEYYLYDDEKDLERLKQYCNSVNTKFTDVEVLVINNPFGKPPYDITNIESVELIKKEAQKYKDFKKICKDFDFENILVIFLNELSNSTEIYGWTYKGLEVLTRKQGGYRNNSSRLTYMTNPKTGSMNVLRLSFDNLSLDRLQIRTSSYLEEQKGVVVSGLGSVGSNLIYFLKNLPVSKFNLIDSDLLSMENINRHFSGFGSIGHAKVDSLELELKKTNPLYEIGVRKKSITQIIDLEPEFINSCDFHLVAIGKSTIEKYILHKVLTEVIKIPTILFWVEPFLASGQMIYINQKDAAKALKILNTYPYHVLSNNQIDKTYLVEGSCQTGYFPYSSTYLVQFLAAVYPYLAEYINSKDISSGIYTWIGDKALLENKGLHLTDFGNDNNTFDIIINDL